MARPDYHRSPDRSRFLCTFEAPGSGPQRTHEASVQDPRRESLVRVNARHDALADAGIDRQAVYVTNAVKHFKREPRPEARLAEARLTADFPRSQASRRPAPQASQSPQS